MLEEVITFMQMSVSRAGKEVEALLLTNAGTHISHRSSSSEETWWCRAQFVRGCLLSDFNVGLSASSAHH